MADVAVAVVVVTVPRPLAAPVVISRNLRNRLDTERFGRRAVKTYANLAPRPLPKPAVVFFRARRPQADTERFERRAVKTFVLKPATALPKPPVNEIWFLRQRLDTEAKEHRAIKTRAIIAIPRALPAPTVFTRVLRQRSDNSSFVKAVAKRINTFTTPRALPAPSIQSRNLRQRSDTERFERRALKTYAVIPSRRLALPPVNEIWLQRNRLNTQAFERRVPIRTVVSIPRALPAPRVELSNFAPYQKFVFVAPTDRARGRVTVISIPRTLPAPAGFFSSGFPEGSGIPPVPDRVTPRLTISLTRPYTAVAAPVVLHRTLPRPASDGGLVVVTTMVYPPFVPRPPTVLIGRAVWRLGSAPIPDRQRNRATVISIPRSLPPAHGLVVLARGRLDTERFERTFGTRHSNTYRAPAPFVAPTTRSTALRQRLDTDARERRVAKRMTVVAIPQSPRPRPTPLIFSPHPVAQHGPQILSATGAWGWAWDFDADGTVISVAAAAPRSQVVGFNENVGRPKQTVGI